MSQWRKSSLSAAGRSLYDPPSHAKPPPYRRQLCHDQPREVFLQPDPFSSDRFLAVLRWVLHSPTGVRVGHVNIAFTAGHQTDSKPMTACLPVQPFQTCETFGRLALFVALLKWIAYLHRFCEFTPSTRSTDRRSTSYHSLLPISLQRI